MKAWQIENNFGLDNLRLCTVEEPQVGRGQIKLRLLAASVNYRDLLMVQGHYNPRQPLPLIPFSDAVGEVVEVGPEVDSFAVGDRACPIFTQSWIDGPLEREYLTTTLGGPRPGVLRELMVVDASAAVHPPEHLAHEEAATLPCAAVTAWRALAREGGARPGHTILTLGTGGVSLFAVQLGAMLGAQVIVTSSSDSKLERAKALGATFGINYRNDDNWGATVMKLTEGRGVDTVVELGGAGTLEQSLRAVRAGGTIALIGVLAGVKSEVALTKILMRGIRVQGVLVGSRRDFTDMNRALSSFPDVRPTVDRRFSFDEVPAALEYLSQGKHFGKVVVTGP